MGCMIGFAANAMLAAPPGQQEEWDTCTPWDVTQSKPCYVTDHNAAQTAVEQDDQQRHHAGKSCSRSLAATLSLMQLTTANWAYLPGQECYSHKLASSLAASAAACCTL